MSVKLFVQPRPPEVPQIIKWAEDNDFGVEVIETASPAALSGDQQELRAWYVEWSQRTRQPIVLHGSYLDIYVHSPDPVIAQAAQSRVEADLEFADRLGARLAVFHTNHLPCTADATYSDGWVKANAQFWRQQSAQFKTSIALENMWDEDPSLLQKLVARTPGLKICFDIAHARIFGKVELSRWFEALGDAIAHIHVSDTFGRYDNDLPLGEGNTDWYDVSRSAQRWAEGVPWMVSVGRGELCDLRTSVDYLRRERLGPWAVVQPSARD